MAAVEVTKGKEIKVDRLYHFAKTTMGSQETDLTKALDSMAQKCATPEEKKSFQTEMEGFKELFARFKSAKGKTIEWDKIKPPHEDLVVPYGSLKDCPQSRISELTKKLCVLKLNGGLGTTMGCTGPKSVIEVHSELSFLDLTVTQIEDLNTRYDADVPLILMNSFNTHDDTLKVIAKYQKCNTKILNFNQSRFPRILRESLLPMGDDPIGHKEHWYPPGHGDVYRAMLNCGLLDKLIAEGREYVFISNIDNLGATVDFQILQYMVDNGVEFVMEVTDKTRSDVKGGTLIEYEGKAKLFEIAQCPSSKVDEFKSIKKFKIFNTNNLWVSLKAIKELVSKNALKDSDVIVNNKKALGQNVIQLETAAGAAIEFFSKAKGVNVPRSRFLPVKSTGDLFVVQSNLYELQNGYLVMNPKRPYPSVPLVNLGEEFKKVSDYNGRLKTIPDTLELDQLTISGDVYIGANVTLKGTVIIVANHGNRIDIPDGAILENKVISGNLRILDH
eukprot:CAMPEP_0168555250 /NCGR_PEP_ID=MMETSP0413-20121227/8230_1 /TAXON_ID=136452 /ORGANISM="Filamoeba nolandi, Strain NC-AS-23-1" /LENGTH=501 /DNA_ID=CAMNT_0008586079 /DNA_START=104 /DNA_END=1609 /DNA_ORIENTATION=-